MSIRERRRTEQLNIRVTPEELTTIRLAAEKAETTVTEFVVSAVLDKANGAFKGTLRRMREAGEI
ncbi:MAG: DUF1778 domain-containing protein [Thermotogota bacterium]